MNLESLGKVILVFAFIFLLIGSVLYFAGKVLGIKHLPGDIYFRKGTSSFYFPLGTSIVASIVITVILNVILAFMKNR